MWFFDCHCTLIEKNWCQWLCEYSCTLQFVFNLILIMLQSSCDDLGKIMTDLYDSYEKTVDIPNYVAVLTNRTSYMLSKLKDKVVNIKAGKVCILCTSKPNKTVTVKKKKKKKNLFSTNNTDRTIHEIIKIATLFEERCQKGQKAISADHLYICFLIINWINPDRQRQVQTSISIVAQAQ